MMVFETPDGYPSSVSVGTSLKFNITVYNEEMMNPREIGWFTHGTISHDFIEMEPSNYLLTCIDEKSGNRINIETIDQTTNTGTNTHNDVIHFYNPSRDISPGLCEYSYRVPNGNLIIKLIMIIHSESCDCFQRLQILEEEILLLQTMVDAGLRGLINQIQKIRKV